MMELKHATIEDAEWLYDLRNHESVRRVSMTDAPVGKLQHYRWLIMQIDRFDKRIMVAWVDGERVGTVRSSRFISEYTLSWAVGPRHRGKGYAKQMLKLFTEPLKGTLNAIIHKDNVASIKVAESAGFVFSKEKSTPNAGWDLYIKEQL